MELLDAPKPRFSGNIVMSHSPLKSDLSTSNDPQAIPRLARRYAQNRTLGVIVFLLIFLLLMFVSGVGFLQSSAFIDRGGIGNHIVLDGAPFWVAWAYLLAPLAPISGLSGHIFGSGGDFLHSGLPWIFWTVQIVYFYLISSVVVSVWYRFKYLRSK